MFLKYYHWVYILFCLLLIKIEKGYCQDNISASVGTCAELSEYKAGTYKSFGLNLQLHLSKRVSLNYQYSFGLRPEGGFYMHLPGLLGGYITLLGPRSFSEADGYLFFLLMLLPEGVSYKFEARKWFEPELFLNPLGADYNHYGNKLPSLSGCTGIRASLKAGNFFYFAPHAGLRIIYRDGDKGLIYGLTTGIRF